MAGFVDAVENEILDHALGTGAWTMPVGSFIQMHIGDPSETGTANPAANATRKSVSWNAAAAGAATNSADIDWTTGEVTTTEVYSHFSLHDAVTAGNPIGTGTVSGGSVTAGNAFKIAAGNLSFSLD